MRTLPCCDCGTAVLASPHDRAPKLSLCLPCWQKAPVAVLLSRSKAHDTGHAVTCRSAEGDPR